MRTRPQQRLVPCSCWSLRRRRPQHFLPLLWYLRLCPENPSMPPCSSIHREVRYTETISRHFGVNKTSRCHQSTPEGITRLVSSFTSPHWMSLKFTVSITLHWFMFVTREYQMLPLVLQFSSLDSSSESFLFCFYSWSNHVFLPRPTPPTSSSFNHHSTQHNFSQSLGRLN